MAPAAQEERMRRIERREFTREASLAFLAGVVVVVSDCGGGGGNGGGGNDGYGGTVTGSNPPPTSADGSKTGTISANHGHVAVITAAELQAGGVLALSIAGTAGHDHIVNLVAQAMQDIKDGKKVAKESTSTQGHTHNVTFNPDTNDPPTNY
jgi:hypothetical protein